MSNSISETRNRWFYGLLLMMLIFIFLPILFGFSYILISGLYNITETYWSSIIAIQFLMLIFFTPSLLQHLYWNYPVLKITVAFTEQGIEIYYYNKLFKLFNLVQIKEILVSRDKRGTKSDHIIMIKRAENNDLIFRTWDLRLNKNNRIRLIFMIEEYCEQNSTPCIYSKAKSKPDFKTLDWTNHQLLSFIKENKRKWWKRKKF